MSASSKYILLSLLGFGFQGLALGNASAVTQYLSDDTPFMKVRQLLAEFEAPLPVEEEAQCLKFLKRAFPENKAEYGRTRQNDLADWLLYQPQHANACTEVMLEILADESADIRWREFCLQKLPSALEQPVLRQDIAEQCMNVLVEKASDPRISFSGTALLGLYRLSKKAEPLFEPEKLAEMAEHVLTASAFPTANKVTALQVAGLSGSETAVHIAREYVADSAASMQLRVSAVALLGSKGSQRDKPVLENLTKSLDLRLRKAAQAALKKLNS